MILSEKILIAEHHFDGRSNKNFPCTMRLRQSCPYCDQLARQVYGYVVLIPDGMQAPGIVFIPPKSVRDIPQFATQAPIAGYHLEAKRASASMKSRLKIALSKEPIDEVPFTKQVEPELVYRWLWNYWGFEFKRESEK